MDVYINTRGKFVHACLGKNCRVAEYVHKVLQLDSLGPDLGGFRFSQQRMIALIFLVCPMASWNHILFVLILVAGYAAIDAARIRSTTIVWRTNYLDPEFELTTRSVNLQNKKICGLCEQFASEAIYYLGENKTQTEIMDILHKACSKASSFQTECVSLVDYYAPLFFVDVAMLSPEEFCTRVNLCDAWLSSSVEKKQDSCNICHQAMAEILLKLKDPDTQLEVIEILLKVCERVEDHAKECKRLIIQFGPIIMANAEKFLEKRDICTTIHACKESSLGIQLPSENPAIFKSDK